MAKPPNGGVEEIQERAHRTDGKWLVTGAGQTPGMDLRLARGLRAIRIRRGLRQEDVGLVAKVSRSLVSKVEGGDIESVSVASLRGIAAAIGATVDVRLRWNGEALDRLLDEAHARVVDAFVLLLRASGWDVAVEVSFSIWGERGSIDILAYHRLTGIVLVVEVKSVVPDSQATLHGLDRKTRLAPEIARERGWDCRGVARLLVVGDSTTSRRRIAQFASLYAAALPDRGSGVRRWLRDPSGPLAGVLFLPSATPDGTRRRQAGRQRVSRPIPAPTPSGVAHGPDQTKRVG
jgi:transcriptional regulator with XRE-family HTH domain